MRSLPEPDKADSTGAPAKTAAPRPLRRLTRRPLALVCCAYLGALVVIALCAPILMPHVAVENAGDLARARELPSSEYPLGTDTLGRDVLERLLVGTRVTLMGVLQALLVVLALGLPLGLVAGYYGGWADRVVTWCADLTFAIPSIIVILVVLATFPESMTAAMITLGVLSAPALMRIVRSAVLPVREDLYIAAARVAGLPDRAIMVRHVWPRITGAVTVQLSLIAAMALLVQSGLAFLNLVVPAPAPSWGGMVADGVDALMIQPWLIWPPGIAISLTAVVLGLLADAVRDTMGDERSGAAGAPIAPGPGRRPTSAETSTRESGTQAALTMSDRHLLSAEGLHVVLGSAAGEVTAVDHVDLSISPGETVGLVGESGCGKTLTATAIMGLLPRGSRLAGGRIVYDGRNLASFSAREMQQIRGRQIGFVSQEPMAGLNPAFRVGWQIAEVVRRHHGTSKARSRDRAVELLRLVRLPVPEEAARAYPHELSGGMAQRVALARALAGDPRLLIADEPTTALDVTVQQEILNLLRDIQAERDMAVLLVTHDWGVVADICDRVLVMYAGQVVEEAGAQELFDEPRHPYTEGLLRSTPQSAVEQDWPLPAIPGSVPKPGEWPAGCRFHPRCEYAWQACRAGVIPLMEPGPEHTSRCIKHESGYADDPDYAGGGESR